MEGRSEQNFDDTFDDIYLNQLNLGYASAVERSPSSTPPATAWRKYPLQNYVALPWVNNTSGNIQNSVSIDDSGNYAWSYRNGGRGYYLTYQPYLLYILNKICDIMGYTGDFSEIEKTQWMYLLICNTLPYTWAAWNFAIALPHWTLTEFFEQLELLMEGEFVINHKAKTIGFTFLQKTMTNLQPVRIDKVVNKYTVEVSQENKSEYKGATNLMYAENDNRMWAYRSCQWFIDEHKNDAIIFNTLEELLDFAETLKECGVETWQRGNRSGGSYTRGYSSGSDGHKLFYAVDVDTYFIMYCYKATFHRSFHLYSTDTDYNYYIYTNRLMAVNEFGKKIVDKEAEDVEINIVPAWIDYTDETLGQCLFLECGEMGDAVTWTEETDENGNSSSSSSGMGTGGFGRQANGDSDTDYNNGALAQSWSGVQIARGEQEKSDAYFDKIYVAFWDGVNRHPRMLPRPMVNTLEINDDFTVTNTPFSLRIKKPLMLDEDGNQVEENEQQYTYQIDNRKKYNYSFLSDEIPDPRALFFIEGGRYVCEKTTATFHENTGKSQLIKGVFYRVIG